MPCFIPYSKATFACYFRCFLTSYICIPVPYNEKDFFLWVLVLKGLVGLRRTIKLQLLQSYWLGNRLVLLWYRMVCLGNKQRSFYRFWHCIRVLHFGQKTWINLNYILLSEKNQSKKAIYSMISIICCSGKDKTTEIIKISMVAMGSESRHKGSFRVMKLFCVIP